mmetsp:Transcript_5323/g.12808  ORF Transcript_5323/g.12808 Transcript_5323/m.12808 type:complete len:112 (-) Transcript_5323:458-793(-)
MSRLELVARVMPSELELVGPINPPPPAFGVPGPLGDTCLIILGVRAFGGDKPAGDVGSSPDLVEIFFGLKGLPPCPFGEAGAVIEPSDGCAPIGVLGGDVEFVPVPSLPFP